MKKKIKNMIRKYIMFIFTLTVLMCMAGGCGNTRQAAAGNFVTEEVRSFDNTENNISKVEPPRKSYEEMQSNINTSEILKQLSIEDKVAQMFIVLPETLASDEEHMTKTTKATKSYIDKIPVGGVVYMSDNLIEPQQVKDMLGSIQEYSINRVGLPLFLCVDEEGGRIARIANNKIFKIDNVGSMSDIGKDNNYEQTFNAGACIGEYLSELGFNLDFAPVVDTIGTPLNTVLFNRTFSDDPYIVSDMADAFSKGLNSKGVISVYKHFPGHGSTTGDPHKGYAVTEKSKEDLSEFDLIPFEKGIKENVNMIMVGHISLPNVTDDGLPASLSKDVITNMLRTDMGYDGIIITDALNMGAIKDNYDSGEAALLAVKAGADIVLMPDDFDAAYNSILTSVKNGEISEERINESVLRIIRLKMDFIN